LCSQHFTITSWPTPQAPNLDSHQKEFDFPEGTCVIKMKEDIQMRVSDSDGNVDIGVSAQQIATTLKNPGLHQSFGLNFILKHKKDILINDHALQEIFTAIAKVSLLETKQMKSLPDEQTENYQTLADAVIAENEQIKVQNEAINKLKNKISLCVPKTKYAKPDEVEAWHYPEDPSDYLFWSEKCYIRV
jgi:hypothetical protein